MIFLRLLFSFLQVGLFSVGGGYAAIPLIRAQVVEQNGWMTLTEFMDLVAISEMTPGPIAINAATFVGIRVAGVGGAVVATLGCIFPSCVIMSILSYMYHRYRKMAALQITLDCMRPVIAALITSAAITILNSALFESGPACFANIQWISLFLFVGAFFIIRKWKWNPICVMLLCGGIYLGGSLLLL